MSYNCEFDEALDFIVGQTNVTFDMIEIDGDIGWILKQNTYEVVGSGNFKEYQRAILKFANYIK